MSTRAPARGAGLGGYLERVFRTAPLPDVTAKVTVDRAMFVGRLLGLAAVILTVFVAVPPPGTHGRGLAIAVTLALSAAAWLVWMLAWARHRPTMAVALIVMAGAGGVLAGLCAASGAVTVGCLAAISAGAQFATDISLGITAETVTAFLITALVSGTSIGFVIGYPCCFAGMWTLGMTRRAYILRADDAEQTLASAQRAHAAETQAAALAERARIAREIHDVLAHSLAAVSVNLQAAEGLLDSLPAGDPSLAKAIQCVGRAETLTRAGMADVRRAVLALRADAAPLADQLASLAADDGSVSFALTGPARPVSAEAGLAVYRTAQEALTNARKHAPGQPVRLGLTFSESCMTLSVDNPLAPAGTSRPLTGTGAGYGLTGLRERAALAGGTLEAGPDNGEWRVCLTIPNQ
jgi:signal transduction histidine kinase